jgi:hypothetical protein
MVKIYLSLWFLIRDAGKRGGFTVRKMNCRENFPFPLGRSGTHSSGRNNSHYFTSYPKHHFASHPGYSENK